MANFHIKDVLKGHKKAVLCACISKNERKIASGGDFGDDTVRVWEYFHSNDSWEETKALTAEGGAGSFFCVAFGGEEDEYLICGAGNGNVMCWKVNGQDEDMLVAVFVGHTSLVWAIVLLPGTTLFITASSDRTMRIWDLLTHREIGRVDTGSPCQCLALSANNRHFAVGHWDPFSVTIWRNTNYIILEKIKALTHHTSYINSLCYSKNGRFFATCSNDKTINLYSDTYQLLKTLRGGHSLWVRCVSFVGYTSMFVSCGNDKKVILWDADSSDAENGGETIGHHTAAVRFVATSADGKLIVSCGYDSCLMVINKEDDPDDWFGDIKNAANRT